MGLLLRRPGKAGQMVMWPDETVEVVPPEWDFLWALLCGIWPFLTDGVVFGSDLRSAPGKAMISRCCWEMLEV